MSRVLGLDYGERRIGAAVSDPTCTIAQPLPTAVRRRGRRPPYAQIAEMVAEWGVARIVIGLPLDSSGDIGPQAEHVQEFGEALKRRVNLPVEYWDERLSSVRARRELARLDLPAAKRRQKGRVDAVAATFILQSYLDAQQHK